MTKVTLQNKHEDKDLSVSRYRELLRQAETALAEAIEQNHRLKKASNQRLGELAHEIKNPLSAIIGFSDMMVKEKHGALGDPRYQEYADLIHKSALHLLGVCQAELDKARSNALGYNVDLPMQNKPVDAAQLIDETLRELASLAEESGVEIRSEIAADFPILKTDPIRLKQVLYNLVSNAIKFTPDKGLVEVKAKVDELDGAVILVIRDTGFGIATEDMLRVMDPFEQVNENSPHGANGSGLGLAIARRLASEMGAILELRSQPNVGTMATLKFPDHRD